MFKLIKKPVKKNYILEDRKNKSKNKIINCEKNTVKF